METNKRDKRARIATSVGRAANKFAPNKFHSCSKDRVRSCCRASFSRTSIQTCPSIFGGRTNFTSQWTRNFGPGSIVSSTTAKRGKIVLCDLNWTRLDDVRFALAQFFDHPASHHHFAKLKNVRINFAPSFRSAALLFAGWLAAQLNWNIEKTKDDDALQFVDSTGRTIDMKLCERAGEPIGEIVLNSREVEFVVARAKCGDLLEVSRGKPGEKRMPQLMPAGSNDPVSLMSEELMRGGPHHVYLRAVNCVRDLL